MQKKMTKNFWAMLVSLLLVCVVGLSGTIAFLSTSSETVTNTFVPGETEVEIEEEFDGEVKENVKVENHSNIEAYVRAKIIVNWVDAAGNVSGTEPEEGPDKDYEMTLILNNGWFDGGDGYYYYSEKLAEFDGVEQSGEDITSELIERCEPKRANGEYVLQVEILAESIQAIPDDAVEDAWGVNASNGTISK